MEEKRNIITEKEITSAKGGMGLILVLLGFIVDIAAIVGAIFFLEVGSGMIGGILLAVGIVFFVAMIILSTGLHVVNPNEAMVFTLFGKYYGTIKKQGFYYLNPFASAINPAGKTIVSAGGNASAGTVSVKKISTKVMTLNNEKQKVNDVLGNPVIIGAVVIWRVKDPTSAVFQVENYKKYLSTQCDSTIRNIARLYPYDVMDEGETEEKTLRGSSQEIAVNMTAELQERVKDSRRNAPAPAGGSDHCCKEKDCGRRSEYGQDGH